MPEQVYAQKRENQNLADFIETAMHQGASLEYFAVNVSKCVEGSAIVNRHESAIKIHQLGESSLERILL